MNRLLIHIGEVAALRWPLFALSLAALLLLDACAVNPATGSPNLVLMSREREKEVGLEEHEKLMETAIIYDDDKLAEYVTEIGNRVARASDLPDLNFQFFVIDSPEINAFALPGGYIYVNRGLITYLNSEAELAAVLAHEVAHVTARHSVQRHARGRLAQVATQAGGLATAVITGSGYAGAQISQIASIWAQAGLSGYGREHELEADRFGAEYLREAGYDPLAMIDTLTVLKNQEDFRRLTTNQGGGYHGLFASHPRNDQRLQQIVSQVRDFDPQATYNDDDSRFLEATEGLIVGESRMAKTNETRNRYYQPQLGYTIVFPDEWNVTETMTTATATGPEQGSLKIEALRLQNNEGPRDFLADRLEGGVLEESEALSQFRLLGHTGLVRNPSTGGKERVAVLYFGPRAYLLRGELPAAGAEEADALLLESIRSFRPIERGEMALARELRIRYVMVDENFDFSVAAQGSKISEYPEETLRLLNGYYPSGSPEPGEWIKLVE